MLTVFDVREKHVLLDISVSIMDDKIVFGAAQGRFQEESLDFGEPVEYVVRGFPAAENLNLWAYVARNVETGETEFVIDEFFDGEMPYDIEYRDTIQRLILVLQGVVPAGSLLVDGDFRATRYLEPLAPEPELRPPVNPNPRDFSRRRPEPTPVARQRG